MSFREVVEYLAWMDDRKADAQAEQARIEALYG